MTEPRPPPHSTQAPPPDTSLRPPRPPGAATELQRKQENISTLKDQNIFMTLDLHSEISVPQHISRD